MSPPAGPARGRRLDGVTRGRDRQVATGHRDPALGGVVFVVGGDPVAARRDRDRAAVDGDGPAGDDEAVLAGDAVVVGGVDGEAAGAGDGEVGGAVQRGVRFVDVGRRERVLRLVAQAVLAALGQHHDHLVGGEHGERRGRGAVQVDPVEHQPHSALTVGLHDHLPVVERAGEPVGAGAGDGDGGAVHLGAVTRHGRPLWRSCERSPSSLGMRRVSRTGYGGSWSGRCWRWC